MEVLLGLPKSGIIVLEEQSWTFRRHGAGVGFKRNRDGIEIEAHVRPFSLSRGIDAWRLLLFLESSGAKRLIADDQAFDVTSLEAVQTMLESLANSGTLEVADDAKRIYLLRT
jgi:hypothetical protein